MINAGTHYQTKYGPIPRLTLDTLHAYVQQRVPTGDFLRAVLSNDLREAIAHADNENIKALRAIVQYCHWEIPTQSWGSPQAVNDYLEWKDAQRTLR